MTGYELTRQWWDFSFENQDKVSSKHCALYMWIIEKNNRLGWVEKFGFPIDEAGAAIGIRKIQTVREALSDLVSWGFVRMIVRSTNQWQSNVISIVHCRVESGTSLDQSICLTENRSSTGLSTGQAPGQPRVEQPVNQGVEHGSGTVPIVKPINQETIKPINQQTVVDADRVVNELVSDPVVCEKANTPSKVAPKVSPKFNALDVPLPHGADFAAAWKDWVIHRREKKSPLTELSVRKQLELCTCYPEKIAIEIILTSITSGYQGLFPPKQSGNGKSSQQLHGNDSPTGTGVSSRLQSAWELLAESRKAHAS